LLSLSISSGVAMPGMRPSVGCPIHAMTGSELSIGKPHTPSQPCMMPTWACWVREMSAARSLMASLLVLSRTISAIWTAWPWWTIISRAKPASAESLAGSWEAKSSASATPAASKDTTASSTSGVFCQEDGERSLRGVLSMPVFYSPNRGGVRHQAKTFCSLNFSERR
jgi:hypothetical protein